VIEPMDKSHRLHFPLTPDAYEGLGVLTAHYSLTEFMAAVAVWTLLKLEPAEGSFITSKMGLKQRLELLIAPAPSAGITNISDFEPILKAFDGKDGLTKRRNDLIHAVWATDDKNKPELAIPLSFPRSGGATAGKHTTADLIEAVIRDLCVEGRKFQMLLDKHNLRQA
jgi:hypothetical protein